MSDAPVSRRRLTGIEQWICDVGLAAGVVGFAYLSEQLCVQERVVRKFAVDGKLPADWWDRCSAIGEHYAIPPKREWFFKRLAVRPARIAKGGVAVVRPDRTDAAA